MKKIFLLIMLIFLAMSYYFWNQNTSPTKESADNQEISNQEFRGNVDTHEFKSQESNATYKITWLSLKDSDQLTLYSNLDKKLTSLDAKKGNSCNSLVNAGFYTIEDKHVGLFINEGVKLSDSKESLLFSGYFWIDEEGFVYINDAPPISAKLALQSGPILMLDSVVQTIKAGNDEASRRMVVATAEDNIIMFITFYDSGSVFSGPTLTELPSLLERLNSDKNLQIVSAVNLDGGSASSFLTENLSLSELTKIGGFFCIKQTYSK
jgi:uncharacterized protein YigE (DUF2233 family)